MEPYKLVTLPHSIPPEMTLLTVLFPVRVLKAYLTLMTDPDFVSSRETFFLP